MWCLKNGEWCTSWHRTQILPKCSFQSTKKSCDGMRLNVILSTGVRKVRPSLRRFARNLQILSKCLWTSPVRNFVKIGRKNAGKTDKISRTSVSRVWGLYMLKVVNNTTRYKKNVYYRYWPTTCFGQFMAIIRLIVLSFHYVTSSGYIVELVT